MRYLSTFFLIIFVFVLNLDAKELSIKNKDIEQKISLISALSETMHTLQQERALSCQYITSKLSKVKSNLKIKIINSDKKIILLSDVIIDKTLNYNSKRKELYNLRKKVNDNKINFLETYKMYSNLIGFILDKISEISDKIDNNELNDKLFEYTTVLNLKESIGQKRATLSALFSNTKFKKEVFEYFTVSDTLERIYRKNFLRSASKELKDLYSNKILNLDIQKVKKYENKAQKILLGKSLNIDVDDWLRVVTLKINMIQSIEYKIFEDVINIGDKIRRDSNIEFTKDEQQWLDNNPIIRMAVMDYWEHDENGNSLHTDILKLINKYGGTQLVVNKYSSWKKGYDKVLKGDEVYAIMNISWSKERESKYFDYSTAYNFSPFYIVTKKENNSINEFEDLQNKTVYLKQGSITNTIIKDLSVSSKIITSKNLDEMYKALSNSTNKDEAILTQFVDEYKIKEANLKISKLVYNKYGESHIGVNKKHSFLGSIINKIFKYIPKKELATLRDKDYSAGKDTLFTKSEAKYLKNKKSVNICTNQNWAPIEFNENNKKYGISLDILDTVKSQLGLEYNFIKTSSWKESQQFLKDRKCDILPSAIKTPKRELYANFTKPYLKYDLVIITHNDTPEVANLDHIIDKKMSRKQGSGLINKLKKQYPNINITESTSALESFRLVEDGTVDFTISTLPVFLYHKAKYGLDNIKLSGYTSIKYNLSVAVRNDDKLLLSVFDKVLKEVPKNTNKLIHDKWAAPKIINKIDWDLMFQVFGLFIFFLAGTVYWSRKLAVAKKIAEETNEKITILLNNAGQGFLYFDKNMMIGKEYSSEVKRIFKRDIRDENITQLLVEDKDDSMFLESTLNDILQSDEMTQEILISLLQSEFKINNAYITVEYKVLDTQNFMMILTDITKNKELAQKIKDEQQVLKMVVETVTTMEQFLSVKNDYEIFIDKIESYKDISKLSDMRKEIHTYKGLFAQKEMLNVVKELHEFESLVDISLKANKVDGKILNITTEEMYSWLEKDIQVLIDILGEEFFDKSNNVIIDKSRINQIHNILVNYIKNKDENMLINLKQDIEKLNYSNIITFLKPYEALVDQLATRLEKTINPLVINSEDIYIADNYKPFLNSLVHIFRNSVDHGIETDEAREESGKDDIGTITCDVVKLDNNIVIKISDDGTGIDEEKIKSLAVSKGIYTQDEVNDLTQDEVLLIIFKDAFSTTENITDISGRGVGLASIINELEKLNGDIRIKNNFGKGIEFTFTLAH